MARVASQAKHGNGPGDSDGRGDSDRRGDTDRRATRTAERLGPPSDSDGRRAHHPARSHPLCLSESAARVALRVAVRVCRPGLSGGPPAPAGERQSGQRGRRAGRAHYRAYPVTPPPSSLNRYRARARPHARRRSRARGPGAGLVRVAAPVAETVNAMTGAFTAHARAGQVPVSSESLHPSLVAVVWRRAAPAAIFQVRDERYLEDVAVIWRRAAPAAIFQVGARSVRVGHPSRHLPGRCPVRPSRSSESPSSRSVSAPAPPCFPRPSESVSACFGNRMRAAEAG